MKVQEILIDKYKRRYLLLYDSGLPVVPVAKYLKYLDNVGKSYNTIKTYSYSLKLYFEYLQEINSECDVVNLEILSDFVGWLRSPYESLRIVTIMPVKPKRCERTINLTITVVTNFYDYLYRTEAINNNYIDKLLKQVYSAGHTQYKDFLYHINRDKLTYRNILKVKEPRKKVRILSKDETTAIYNATKNIRDELLIKLLHETGLRIGEALSLYIEDFIYDHLHGHKIKLIERGDLANGAELKTGEREIFISQELMDLFDDYEYEILDELEVDTNFIFIKLSGINKGQPLEYQDVNALFRRLRKTTGINVHAHLFRHTHATLYYYQTKDIKQVQERLGHKQIQTTMNTYMHPSDEEIRKSWELAQSAFEIHRENEK